MTNGNNRKQDWYLTNILLDTYLFFPPKTQYDAQQVELLGTKSKNTPHTEFFQDQVTIQTDGGE